MKGNTGTWLTTWAYLDCAIIFLTLTRTIVRKEIATIPIPNTLFITGIQIWQIHQNLNHDIAIAISSLLAPVLVLNTLE